MSRRPPGRRPGRGSGRHGHLPGPRERRSGIVPDRTPIERPPPVARPALGAVRETPGAPSPGEILLFTRPGFEPDLVHEAAITRVAGGRFIEPGLVVLPRMPSRELAFARQLFPVAAVVPAAPRPAMVDALAQAIARMHNAPGARAIGLALQVTVPDSDTGNRHAGEAATIEALLGEAIREPAPGALLPPREAREAGGLLVQACLLRDGSAAIGALPARDAPSLYPGGRRRLARRHEAPSRAALKLEEAFEWIGRAPERGERCADLGAAPGGWTHVLAERGARVVAVDPARLRPEIVALANVRHVQRSAFDYEPEQPFDWVLCDMAWRPLEVAALLAKWGRRGYAETLLANVKLPMKRRAELLERVREILASGGWQGLRIRQLYHDRDEVTLGAWRIP